MTRKPEPVDMSPQAIDNRLEDLRQLYRLMLSFAEIKLVGPVERPTQSSGPVRDECADPSKRTTS